MKKIISTLLVFLLTISPTFAYTPTAKDQQTAKAVILAVQNFPKEKTEFLQENLGKVLANYKKDDKTKYLLTELQKHFENKKEILTETLYSVLSIIDGDTIKINYEGENINVRMIGIDAPENSTTRYGYIEDYGDQAKAKLTELIGNNQVRIELDDSQGKYDTYNRLLAYIFVGDTNINQEMIEIGFAKEYTYNKPYRYQKEFLNSQQGAISNKLGIWQTEENILVEREYITGPRGGCYYLNENETKIYVDHSFCN